MYYTTKLSPSVFLPVFLRWTKMRGRTPTMLLTTSGSDGIDSSPVIMARPRAEPDIIQPPTGAWQKTPSSRRTDPKILRRKKIPFAGIASGPNWILGTQPACDCTHFPNTRRECQPTYASHQKQQQGTRNHSQQPQLTRALTSCAWNRFAGETFWHSHGNSTEGVLLPRPNENPQCHTTLLEFKTVQMVSLSPTNHVWQNLGWHSG